MVLDCPKSKELNATYSSTALVLFSLYQFEFLQPKAGPDSVGTLGKILHSAPHKTTLPSFANVKTNIYGNCAVMHN